MNRGAVTGQVRPVMPAAILRGVRHFRNGSPSPVSGSFYVGRIRQMTAREYKPPFSRGVASRFRRLRGQVANEPSGERPLFERNNRLNGRGADSVKDDCWPDYACGTGGLVIALPNHFEPRAQLHLRVRLCTPFTSREQTYPPAFASSMALSAKPQCRWSLLRRSRRASILRRGGVALAMPVRPQSDRRANDRGER